MAAGASALAFRLGRLGTKAGVFLASFFGGKNTWLSGAMAGLLVNDMGDNDSQGSGIGGALVGFGFVVVLLLGYLLYRGIKAVKK